MNIDIINNRLIRLVPDYIDATSDPRKRLYTLLTLINVDVPSDLCQYIEEILLRERSDIVSFNEMPITKQIGCCNSQLILYKGDITKLAVDAIVNAANFAMLGCFDPTHKCIDNVIHSKAGPRLRMECRSIYQKQGKLESNARITYGYCLPCKYIIHVAGPIYDPNKKNQVNELANCYSSSLDVAKAFGIKTIAFCCISTGLYSYPKKEAACIAINIVKQWSKINNYGIAVIFNTFTEDDHLIYKEALC